MYKIGRVVIGENKTFVGGEDYLKQRGVEVVVFDDEKCKGLMSKFIAEKPAVWYVLIERPDHSGCTNACIIGTKISVNSRCTISMDCFWRRVFLLSQVTSYTSLFPRRRISASLA